jgi:hypothetical protein
MGVGSWLRDRPRILESAYRTTHNIFQSLDPLISGIGYSSVEAIIRWPEEWLKGLVFDCRMCGMCVLHSTGMTCPMTCPKTLRNGPCGGVRDNGNCEVIPDMRCVWVEAYERSLDMRTYGEEIHWLQPPVNRQLEGRSAWITMLTTEDQELPAGWKDVRDLTIIQNADE